MKTKTVRIARIYLTEADHQLNDIMLYLQASSDIAGATAFRALEGYGKSGEIHEATLLDLSFDLPITVEFFDESDNVLNAIEHLQEKFNVGQAVSWLAQSHN